MSTGSTIASRWGIRVLGQDIDLKDGISWKPDGYTNTSEMTSKGLDEFSSKPMHAVLEGTFLLKASQVAIVAGFQKGTVEIYNDVGQTWVGLAWPVETQPTMSDSEFSFSWNGKDFKRL